MHSTGYVDWIKRFIWFQGKRHPKDMGAREIEAFLTHLAVKGKVRRQRRIKPRVRFCFSMRNNRGCSMFSMLPERPQWVGSGRLRLSKNLPGSVFQAQIHTLHAWH